MSEFDYYDDEQQQQQPEGIDLGQTLKEGKDLYDRYKDHASPENNARGGDSDFHSQDLKTDQSGIMSGDDRVPDVDYSSLRGPETAEKGLEGSSSAVETATQAQEISAEAAGISGVAAETAEGMVEGAAKDVAAQAVEKGAEAAAEKGAEAAAGAAAEAGAGAAAEAGASTTGVGAVAVAVLEAIKAAGKVASSWGEIVTGKTKKNGFGMILLIIIFLLIFNGNMNFVYKNTFGSIAENYIEGQYSKKFEIRDIGWGFNWFFNLFDDDEEDEVGDFDSVEEFTEGCDKAKKYINKGFKRALDIAKNSELPYIIESEGYDYELTMQSYESEEEHFYDDINYAEMIEVIQQKEELNSENLVYKDFKKLFNPVLNSWKLQLLYRMKVEPDYAEKVIEQYDLEGNVIGTTTETVLYGKVTLRHYDLESLYEFVGVDAQSYNAQVDNMLNIDFLDESEENLRCYADYYNFGPNKRTVWSYGFEKSDYKYSGNLIEEFERIIIGDIDSDEELKVGDLIFYADRDYNARHKNIGHVAMYAGNDMIVDASSSRGAVVYRNIKNGRSMGEIVSICRPIPDGDDATRQQVLDFALSQQGKEYSRKLRTVDGYYDCSSFVDAVYRTVGIKFGYENPVAADICKYCESKGQLKMVSYPRK